MSMFRKIQENVLAARGSKEEEKLTYQQIGGLGRELEMIREVIERPLREPEIFTYFGITPPRGILLYGPPGCGKTLIARTIAQETHAHFIGVNGSDIVRNHYGESEERLREIFQEAQDYPHTILFFDEIDALAPKRDGLLDESEKRLVSELLALLDGIHQRGNVIFLAATNLPNDLDPALRRPGRLDREIPILPPDKKGRREILAIHSRNIPLDKDVDLDALAEATPGFLGADLEILCKEAVLHRIRDLSRDNYKGQRVRMEDFQKALSQVSLSTNREVKKELPTVHFSDIANAIQVVARGDALIQPSVMRRLVETFAAQRGKPQVAGGKLNDLTEREREVLIMVARGLTNAEIGEQLVISAATVKTHVARIMGKLDVHDRAQLVMLAYEAGLVVPGQS